jgi:hypothetical protein
MTIHEQVALATDKVAHWNGKRDHATAMLTKWQSRLSALQAKDKPQPKPQPTAMKLPPVTLVPGSEQFMPRAAVKSASDVAAAQALARETALADIAEAGDKANGKVAPIKGKTQPKKPKKH